MTSTPKPLFRDPVYDGAADPTLIWNRGEHAWWMVYTNRRATAPRLPGVEWIHGTDLGVASSTDGGVTWTYRGTLPNLEIEWGRNTFWAPEIIDDGRVYHLYVSCIRGVPSQWAGHPRRIRHYTSPDLLDWSYRSTLELSSQAVIDACVVALPGGGYRMWYKDESDGASTWSVDSDDLYAWGDQRRVVAGPPHEGPNVFRLGGSWWMVTDEWHGQRVHRSDDLESWEPHGLILDRPGREVDDGTVGLHADVVPIDDTTASIFYFTHPERAPGTDPQTVAERRTSIQVARLRADGTSLQCDRDAPLTGPVLPFDTARDVTRP